MIVSWYYYNLSWEKKNRKFGNYHRYYRVSKDNMPREYIIFSWRFGFCEKLVMTWYIARGLLKQSLLEIWKRRKKEKYSTLNVKCQRLFTICGDLPRILNYLLTINLNASPTVPHIFYLFQPTQVSFQRKSVQVLDSLSKFIYILRVYLNNLLNLINFYINLITMVYDCCTFFSIYYYQTLFIYEYVHFN